MADLFQPFLYRVAIGAAAGFVVGLVVGIIGLWWLPRYRDRNNKPMTHRKPRPLSRGVGDRYMKEENKCP